MRRRDFIKSGVVSGLITTLPIAGAETLQQSTTASTKPDAQKRANSRTDTSTQTEPSAPFPPTYYRTAMIEGISVSYREAGQQGNPVILLLHGWPSSSRMYRNLIPLLANKYHVIAPDYPGFGHSGVPPRGEYNYSFDRMGEIVEALIEKLQIETFALYIMDFGAPIGFRLMLKKPGRVTALIAQNAPAYPSGSEWFKVLAQYWKDGLPQSRQNARAYLDPEAIKQHYLTGVRDVSRIDPDDWLIDTCLMNRPGLDEIHLDMLYDIRSNGPVFKAAQEYFRTHRPPTLIVTGANDVVFSGEYMKRYLADLPGAEFHLLDTGHFALEDHCDEIASLMRDFLERTVKNV
ncbi:alpha/beta fold hydrolase [Acidicapsa ligni]|uniref:alpha/beta fold hydrolase n=1 Tax=Acidicapsa ligni TaxID=542300 RepID=UPI0021E0A65A|nr:alpha/beta fold hydrolase [Acidicapsa ligni]